MEFWSWVMAVILGLSAIISPIVTAIINNKYQLSLKKIDTYEELKRKSLENFLECSANIHYNDTLGAVDRFNQSVASLYIYFKDVPEKISSIQDLRNTPDFFDEVTNVVQVLTQQITKE